AGGPVPACARGRPAPALGSLFLPRRARPLRDHARDERPEIEAAAAVGDERELGARRRPARPAIESLRAGQLDAALTSLLDVLDPDFVIGFALEVVDDFLAVLEIAQFALVGDVGDPLAVPRPRRVVGAIRGVGELGQTPRTDRDAPDLEDTSGAVRCERDLALGAGIREHVHLVRSGLGERGDPATTATTDTTDSDAAEPIAHEHDVLAVSTLRGSCLEGLVRRHLSLLADVWLLIGLGGSSGRERRPEQNVRQRENGYA